MRDRLVELIREAKKQTKNANCDIGRNMIFADYLLANGVIVPPCKVGDTVYETDGVRIYESTIKQVIYDTTGVAFDERAIGTSIFLTREEAEQALKGGVE